MHFDAAAMELFHETLQMKDAASMRTYALASACRLIGADDGIFASHTQAFFSTPPLYVADYLREPTYRQFLLPAFAASRAQDGIYTDGEVFASRSQRDSAFFCDLLRPHHIASQIVAVVHYAGRVSGVIHLNRAHKRFRNEEALRLRPLMRAIGLVHAALERTPLPFESTPDSLITQLSPREREVAMLVARGRTNAEIGEILGTAKSTVRHQVEAILRKCGLDNRAGIAALVQRDMVDVDAKPTLPAGMDNRIITNIWRDMQSSIPTL